MSSRSTPEAYAMRHSPPCGRVRLILPGMGVRGAAAGLQVMNEQRCHEDLAGGGFEDLDAEPVRAGVRGRRRVLRRHPCFAESAKVLQLVSCSASSAPAGSTCRSASATTALPTADVLLRPSADAGNTTPATSSRLIALLSPSRDNHAEPDPATHPDSWHGPDPGMLMPSSRSRSPRGPRPRRRPRSPACPRRGGRTHRPSCLRAAPPGSASRRAG